MKRWNRNGQVTVEIAVLFGMVVAGLVFMGIYLQRGVQGAVKSNTDAVGQQFSTSGAFNSFTDSNSHETNTRVTSGQCSDYSHGVGGGAAIAANCTAPPAP